MDKCSAVDALAVAAETNSEVESRRTIELRKTIKYKKSDWFCRKEFQVADWFSMEEFQVDQIRSYSSSTKRLQMRILQNREILQMLT